VAKDPSYPGIGDDYRRTFHILEALKPDIWLAAHNEVWNLAGKRERAAKEGVQAYVDPEGYRLFVVGQRR
jgi:metallo-beta-lactamase class B